MHDSRRYYDDQKYVHFVTFVVEGRRRLLDCDQIKRIFLGVFTEILEQRDAYCAGFVIMPNHVHLLIWLSGTGQLSRFVGELKRRSSLLIRKWYVEERPQYLGQSSVKNRFWQPGFHSFEIFDTNKIEEKLDYMHLNPVRSGLVEKATDWKWSSARWYLEGHSVGIALKWPD